MGCPRGFQLSCPSLAHPCQCVPMYVPPSPPKRVKPKQGGVRGLGETMSYQSMYSRRGPEGVPNPYEPAIEIYPNYVHGSDYTRPYFSEPYLVQPYNVLEGLGAASSEQRTMGVLKGAGAGAAVLGLMAAVAVPERRGRALLTGVILGGLVGVMSAWLAVESVSEG